MQDLAGKVAVITGGASGIGLAMARAFAAEGMHLVLADIEADALDAAVASFADDVEVVGQVCDVSDGEQVEALRDAAIERFGAVHVVCNNAGVGGGGPVWTTPISEWEWVLGVNLWGVIHGIRAFTPLLIEQGEGHIVNTASFAGLASPPFMSAYNVSKHGVVTLSETLFADLALAGADGVGVSVLCPGWVRTRIHEAARNRPAAIEGEERTAPDPGMQEFIAGVIAGGLDPAEVGATVVEAVKSRRFYILTHEDWAPFVTERAHRIAIGADPILPKLPGADGGDPVDPSILVDGG